MWLGWRSARPRGPQLPPVASSALMLLLLLVWWTGVGESLALEPSLLTSPSQAYRLVSYCLCHMDAALLATNLLCFPPLAWRLERQQGPLRYLCAAAVGAATSALLYLLLAGLCGTLPGPAVGSYLPVHLATLGCRQRHGGRPGWAPTALWAGLLLALGQVLPRRPPLLLHLCGLLTGLAGWARMFSPLELSEQGLERLCCWARARGSLLPFVAPPAAGILPTIDPVAQRERSPPPPELPAQDFSPSDLFSLVLQPIPASAFYWRGGSAALGQDTSLSPASASMAPFSAYPGASDMPLSALQASLTNEELLQAGIQASLQDMAEEEVKLSKSSVSSLRLQQLQKMGFPTERAVVALAAMGHVEGAVSLLTGDHFRDQAVVAAESWSERPGGPRQVPASADWSSNMITSSVVAFWGYLFCRMIFQRSSLRLTYIGVCSELPGENQCFMSFKNAGQVEESATLNETSLTATDGSSG